MRSWVTSEELEYSRAAFIPSGTGPGKKRCRFIIKIIDILGLQWVCRKVNIL
jgi:hypothetical protein